MRGNHQTAIFITACLWIISITASSYAGVQFLEDCLGKDSLSTLSASCKLQDKARNRTVQVDLTNEETIKVQYFNEWGEAQDHYELVLRKVQHLPPRVSEKGMFDESIRFIAVDGSDVVTMTLQCQQREIGLVGFGKLNNKGTLPKDMFAACSAQ